MEKNKRMKEIVIIVAAGIIACIVGMMAWNCIMYYDKEVKVIEVSDNIVKVIDKIDEIWEFETDNPEQFKVGEKLSVKMDTMGSDFNIYDDRIVDVKKINNN